MDTTDNAITVICFSPTHNSRKIAEAVAAGMSTSPAGATVPIRVLDLTLDRKGIPVIPEAGGTIILGAPVYAGRLAPEAVRRLRRIQVPRGIIVPTVLTVTYGNRDYEDALVEMYDLAVELGLSPIAAGAFIGEHSYSTPALPIAEGRPDSLDLADARIFGGQCRRKLETSGAFAPFRIKGNRPYKIPTGLQSETSGPVSSGNKTGSPVMTQVPVTADGCPLCGECAAVCPTGAIVLDIHNTKKVITDPGKCIRCCACVKACPAGMRTYSTPFAAILHERFQARRDPETFL